MTRPAASQATCCVADGDIPFEVEDRARQGCVISTMLFNLVVDWIIRRTTEDKMDLFLLLPGKLWKKWIGLTI